MHRRYRNYALLAVLFIAAMFYEGHVSIQAIDDLRFATTRPRAPFDFGFRMRAVAGMTPEAARAGIHRLRHGAGDRRRAVSRTGGARSSTGATPSGRLASRADSPLRGSPSRF